MHETVWRGIDPLAKNVFGDNSWGPDFGVGGSMTMSWDVLERLLAEQGDGTVNVSLIQPAPVPVPVPPLPVTVPVPVPTPVPDIRIDGADRNLYAEVNVWQEHHHLGRGDKRMADAAEQWIRAKGFH